MWKPSYLGSEEGETGPVPSETGPKIQLIGRSSTLAGSLASLGTNLVGEVCQGPPAGPQGRVLQLLCRGEDEHALVLSWVETLLYLLDERRAALVDIQVQVSRTLSLTARFHSQAIASGKVTMPKALVPDSARATLSESGLWQAECTLVMDPA